MTTLEGILSHYGVHPRKKSGAYLAYRCPFHDDKDPSFLIYKRQPDWAYCFGCARSYGILDVIEHFEGADRREAVRIANERWGCEFGNGRRQYDPPKPTPVERLVQTAHQYLLDNWDEIALLWRAAKGYDLTKQEARRFKLGYLSPEDEDLDALAANLKMKKTVVRRFLGRLLFPVRKPSGELVGCWGRDLGGAAWKTDVKNLYIPIKRTDTTVPYLISHYRWDKPLLIVESASDAVAANTALRHLSCIAAGGAVSRITPETFTALELDPPQQIIYAPDPDREGKLHLIRRASEILRQWNGSAFVLDLPGKKDLDELIRIDGMAYDDLKDKILPLKQWLDKVTDDSDEIAIDIDDLVTSCAAEAAKKEIEKDEAAETDLVEILRTANAMEDEKHRKAYLSEMAKARGISTAELIKQLRGVLHRAYLENPKQTTFVHPAMYLDANVASVGFRAQEIFLGEKTVFNLYVVAKSSDDGIVIDTYTDESKPVEFEVGGELYAIDRARCALPDLNDTWGVQNLRTFISFSNSESPQELYGDLRQLFRSYVYLERDEDYDILTTYTILTYVHRVFPAIPFLLLYGNKESGKTRTASLLQRLCFSAQMVNRPSEAAMGDLLDGFRGTLIIDQAEFLALKQFEPIVNFLAGTYTQDTGKRAIVQIGGKGGRNIRHFDAFGPKVFGGTRDPHPDLRDRLIVVPFLRPENPSILTTLKTPTSDSEDWKAWRGRLYAMLLTRFRQIIQTAEEVAEESGNRDGRRGELTRPIVTVLRFCGADQDLILEIEDLIEQRIEEIRPTITRLDEQILLVLYEMVRERASEAAYVEVPISAIKRRCAESEDTSAASYESVIWEVLKRNQAFLRSKRKWGELMIYTNMKYILKALKRLGCTPREEEDVEQSYPQQLTITTMPTTAYVQ